MSEAEFDSYLSLLSKFLRLRARQRGELADELRDHLDTRLEELLAAGKTREQAVAVALEEFGDAAVLATEFSRLASRRTRRFVMRCTAASAAVVAAVVLLSVSLAPPGPNGPGPRNVAAQQGPAAEGAGGPGGAESGLPGMGGVPAEPDKSSIEQQAVAALDEKLAKPVKADFAGVPLREVLEGLANDIAADVLIAEPALTDAGVALDDPVTLRLTRTPLAARTVFEFILEPRDLALVNRAGVIFVTTAETAEELVILKVYNVRDLIDNVPPDTVDEWVPEDSPFPDEHPGIGGRGYGGAGGGFFTVRDVAAAGLFAVTVSQAGGGLGEPGPGMDSGGGAAAPQGAQAGGGKPEKRFRYRSRMVYPVSQLAQLLQTTTSGPWFDVDGVGGTMSPFNGLLAVRQTEQVHGEIQKLLDALRKANRQQPGGSVTVPKAEAAEEPAASPPGLSSGPGGMSGMFGGLGGLPGMSGVPGGFGGAGDAAPSAGLGERFAEYHPTAEMRQMFFGMLGEGTVPPGEIGEVRLFRSLLAVGGPAQTVFHTAGIDAAHVQLAFEQSFSDRPIGDLYEFLDAAQAEAAKQGVGTIDTGHLLAVLLDRAKDGPLRELLARLGVNADQVRDWVNDYRKATPAEERNPLQVGPNLAQPKDDLVSRIGVEGIVLSADEMKVTPGGASHRQGYRITLVRADGLAKRAGLRIGDVVLRHGWHGDDEVADLRILRDGQEQVVEVRFGAEEAAASEPSTQDEPRAASDEPVKESRIRWPDLGLRMAVVERPRWLVDGRPKERPIGLRVEEAPASGPSGLRRGDVIVSWSADRWTANPEDSNVVNFGGQVVPSPERITRAVARIHGAKSIVFQVVRAEDGLPRLATAQMPIGGPAEG